MRRASLSIEVRSPQFEADPGTDSLEPGADPAKVTGPILDFIASDETLDRYGEVISAAGWRLETYRRNPVFQNAHQYGDVLFTLGRALITEVRCMVTDLGRSGVAAPKRSEGGPVLYQRIQFATDVNPIARIAYGLYQGKFLNAVSVGFIPLRWQDADDGLAGQPGSAPETSSPGLCGTPFRRRYLEQELLEVSAVGIPANPNALALGLKQGAIDKGDLRETLELLLAMGRGGHWEKAAGGFNADEATDLFQLARELHGILRHA